jgi:hypothetical protein
MCGSELVISVERALCRQNKALVQEVLRAIKGRLEGGLTECGKNSIEKVCSAGVGC